MELQWSVYKRINRVDTAYDQLKNLQLNNIIFVLHISSAAEKLNFTETN